MLKIWDLEGRGLTVTDLNAAIKATEGFIGYRHSDKRYARSDNKRREYWEDILKKLKQVKQQQII
jgi:hypothetical protein